MQIFTVNITRVAYHVTNVLDLRYFCEHNPLFYHLNLITCRYCVVAVSASDNKQPLFVSYETKESKVFIKRDLNIA